MVARSGNVARMLLSSAWWTMSKVLMDSTLYAVAVTGNLDAESLNWRLNGFFRSVLDGWFERKTAIGRFCEPINPWAREKMRFLPELFFFSFSVNLHAFHFQAFPKPPPPEWTTLWNSCIFCNYIIAECETYNEYAEWRLTSIKRSLCVCICAWKALRAKACQSKSSSRATFNKVQPCFIYEQREVVEKVKKRE